MSKISKHKMFLPLMKTRLQNNTLMDEFTLPTSFLLFFYCQKSLMFLNIYFKFYKQLTTIIETSFCHYMKLPKQNPVVPQNTLKNVFMPSSPLDCIIAVLCIWVLTSLYIVVWIHPFMATRSARRLNCGPHGIKP